MKPVLLLAFVSVWAQSMPEALAEWIADAEGGAFYDGNVSRAQLSTDIKSDTALYAAASLGQVMQLTDSTNLVIAGAARSESYLRYTGLSNVAYGLTSSIRSTRSSSPT